MSEVVVITGAAQGLGLELVREALKRNYVVFALDKSISRELEAIADDRLYIYECDISDNEQIEESYYQITRAADKVDVLINCAGIWLDRERKRLDDENFEFEAIFKQFEVNAVGTLRMMKRFISLVEKSDKKTIINLSSEAGSIEDSYRKGEYGYCMSKAALNMACKLTKNAYPHLKIYAVHPGWMQTPQGYAGATGECSPDQKPEDTAMMLLNLAEEEEKDYIYLDHTGKKLNW